MEMRVSGTSVKDVEGDTGVRGDTKPGTGLEKRIPYLPYSRHAKGALRRHTLRHTLMLYPPHSQKM